MLIYRLSCWLTLTFADCHWSMLMLIRVTIISFVKSSFHHFHLGSSPPLDIRIQPPLPRWHQHQRRLKTANKSKLAPSLSLKHPHVLFFLPRPSPCLSPKSPPSFLLSLLSLTWTWRWSDIPAKLQAPRPNPQKTPLFIFLFSQFSLSSSQSCDWNSKTWETFGGVWWYFCTLLGQKLLCNMQSQFLTFWATLKVKRTFL